MSQPLDIAIIGMAGCFPEARDLRAYWGNILDKVDAVADADPDWVGPYFEENTSADDRTYTIKGGFLRDLAEVDPQSFGVMPSVAAGSDPDHMLALKLARDALADAGYMERDFDRQRTGVIIGRGTYANRAFGSTLARGFFFDQMLEMIQILRPDFSDGDMRELRQALKDQLPPHSGEHVGVLTPNVIAGMIANRLDLMGPSFIVDAACASSMMALESAVREIASGRCEMMITGGVHAHTPPQLFIQFSLIKALSRDRIRPFQTGADGTLLGEGAGLMVLKSLAAAQRDGDRIYSVIKGIGSASDGKAMGLLAPRMEGEALAVQRAYESSGIDPASVELIEAHGTGTPTGDKTEIDALNSIFGGRDRPRSIALTAVKSMIGHCMPASGSAAMIKTAMAVHQRVLPPMLCDEPDPALGIGNTPFYINTETRPWVSGQSTPRRAGVNSFGFGGINSHVILEEYREPRSVQVPVLHLPQGPELFLLAAETPAELAELAGHALRHLQGAVRPELKNLAGACAEHAQGDCRLAVLASSHVELEKRLQKAIEALHGDTAPKFGARSGIHFGRGDAGGKLCFLFPGEGSQYAGMLQDVCLRYPQVREWFDVIEAHAQARGHASRSDVLFPVPTMIDAALREQMEAALFDMDFAAESVFAASLGLYGLYRDLGFQPQALLGHSTGENTALAAWTGGDRDHRQRVLDAMQALGEIQQRLAAAGQIKQGTLLTIGGLDSDARAQLLADPGDMLLAMDNCPNQLVLFGSAEQAAELKAHWSDKGAVCFELPFGRAYHTPQFQPMAEAIHEYYGSIDLGTPQANVDLYSACAVAPFPHDAAGICSLTARQWAAPVRFTETVERLYADGYRYFVELGPSGNLSAFVGDTLREHADVQALASNNRRRSGIAQLHATLAQLHAAGVAFSAPAVYAKRATATVDLTGELAKPRKPMQTLTLRMPVVTLPEAFRRPLPASGAVAAASLEQSATPVASSDPRQAAVRAHFELMQDFLQSQSRVLDMANASVRAPQPEVAKPRARALLGPVVERNEQRLVSSCHYDLANAPILSDHSIGAAPEAQDDSLRPLSVMPFTFSMELVAEAAAELTGLPCVIAVEEARGSRWLSLDNGNLELQVVAERTAQPDRVSCRVLLPGSGPGGNGLLVFEARVRLAADFPQAPQAEPWPAADNQAPVWHVDGQIYSHGMFHGPRLQGCRKVLRWGEGGMEAELTTLPSEDYFASKSGASFEFDAALLDAAGQLAGFWLRERYSDIRNCFPFRVESLQIFGPPPAAGTGFTCRGKITLDGDSRLIARWDIIDEQGVLHMRAQGWEDRVFQVPERFAQFRALPEQQPLSDIVLYGRLPEELCLRRLCWPDQSLWNEGAGIWLRVVAHMCLSQAEHAQFHQLPERGPRRQDWLLGRLTAKEAVRDWYRRAGRSSPALADISIIADALGAPRVSTPEVFGVAPAVSISHCRGEIWAIAADAGLSLGVDYQRYGSVRADDVAVGAFAPEELHFLDSAAAVDRQHRIVALWAAKEAAAKAAGSGLEGRPQDWRVTAAKFDGLLPGEPRLARVRKGGRDFDVSLHADSGDDGVLAVCAIADPAAQAHLPAA